MNNKVNKKEMNLFYFYVIKCPVEYKKNKIKKVVSHQGIHFSKLNYTPQEIIKLIKAINKLINNNIKWYTNEINEEVIETEIKENNGYSDENFEYIAIVENPDMKKTKSIFYMIRNGFAHGDYKLNNKQITLVSKNKGKIKCKMRLNIETLFKIEELYLTKSFIKEDSKNGDKRN